jgi:peptide/nickel transport system substrate-binding protein
MPFFCAVPPNLPADPEGVTAFPGAGPYYVAEYVRGRRVLLKRNRYYGGTRPRHVDQFVADLQANALEEVLDRIERGAADWGLVPAPIYFQAGRAQKFRRKYGINRSRFFVKPGLAIRLLVLNTSRPLFGNNARLRRAVNFAVDRPALVKAAGGRLAGTLTDQYLPPSMPGFRDAHIYPVARPNVQRARALARWHTRSKRAVLYTFDVPDPGPTVAAQIVRNNLAKIGLQVEIKKLPPEAYFNRVTAPNEPFDIALYDWGADYVDPFSYLNLLLDGRFIGGVNWSRFNSAKYNRLMRRAARLKGLARYRRYGSLDVQLARGAAPMVAVFAFNEPTLVSKRVDRRCIVLRPTLDLTAVCLKR